MSEINAAQTRCRAAHEARKKWAVQKERLAAEIDRLNSEIPKLEALAANAASAKSSMLANFVSGNCSQQDVSQARQAEIAAVDSVTEARELLDAVAKGVTQNAEEYFGVVREQEKAQAMLCQAVCGSISEKIRADKKLRRSLIEAFGAICAINSNGFNSNSTPVWEGLLEEIFPSPIERLPNGNYQRSDDLMEAIDRFMSEYIKPIYGTV